MKEAPFDIEGGFLVALYMTGTIVNTGTVLLGSAIGLSVGRYLPERIKTTAMQALGLSVLLIGMQMALSGKEVIAVIACLLLGAIAGEALRIEQGIAQCGAWLKGKTGSQSGTFVEGFVTASVLYCTGAMMIVGAIQDGTTGDAGTLYIKSILDGVASVALASTLGIGVAFSALSVFITQGAITVLASKLLFLQDPRVLAMITATGGLMILGIGTNILGLTKIRIGNLIPGLIFAILWAVLHG